MALIWTTTMPPFSYLPHAWLDSLNTGEDEVVHTPEPPHTQKHTGRHMLPLNWSHVFARLTSTWSQKHTTTVLRLNKQYA